MSDEEGVTIPLMYRDIPSHGLFACEPPDTLYHYTDYEGARGIIESKSMWLTKLSYLNDRSELKLAISMFTQGVDDWLQKIKCSDKKLFLQEAAHQLQSFQDTNICVASFCENGDLLSQWRSYGNGGNGVALAFNSKCLKKLLTQGLMNLWKCVYSPDQQRMVIEGLITILLNSYDIMSSRRGDDENWKRTKTDLIGYFNTTFLRVAPVIKNNHFSEEKEWRIITVPIPHTNANWFSRITNKRVSQYYHLDLCSCTEGNNEFLHDIRVGPTNEPRLICEAFRVLLHKCSYGFKQVQWSEIPFRSK